MKYHSTCKIHESSVIEDGAKIGKRCRVGPFCSLGKNVELDDDVDLISHVSVAGVTRIGSGTKIWPFASVGNEPQDLKYKGEKTKLEIGKNNQIRESVSISPGTSGGGGLTKIGNNCLFMLASHVGHDCLLGNNIIIANNSAIAGHVIIEDNVNIGGLVGVHQFCRIGEGSIIGAHSMVSKDVIPFSLIVGQRATLAGVNLIGLKRRGHQRESLKKLQNLFSELFDRKKQETFFEKVNLLGKGKYNDCSETAKVLGFIKSDSARSFVTPV
jgi:UDP-N-acetylglucosamine acyltransferase